MDPRRFHPYPPTSQGRLSPAADLGLFDATMVGIGAMIGAGIFVLTCLATKIAGPDTELVAGENYVVAVEEEIADEVRQRFRG